MRASVDEWVSRWFPGATYADGGGQRLVYRVPAQAAALKIWVATDASQHERHVREVSALARLAHPNLPRVHAPITQIEIKDRLLAYYLEEWIDAPSLKSQLSTLPLSEAQFRQVGAALAAAVNALHEANIVHRDISLGNVLVGRDSSFVIDLGLAKHLDLESLTQAGERLPRTEVTASPEQLQGASADLRKPTDIFSLGVVFAMASSGRHPFMEVDERIELGTLIHRQLSHDVRHLPQGEVGELISRMLDPVMIYRPTAGSVQEILS